MKSPVDTQIACDWTPSPNFGERRGLTRPDMLILHYTGMPSADGALKWLCMEQSQVSCHYFVFEDGRVTQLVAEAARAWHAGLSCWAGERDINSCSIGIEIAYPGPPDGQCFADAPDFPDAQMRAVEDLCRDIVSRHAIPAKRVLAHSDVAPARKIDPGNRFNWRRLAAGGVGLWVEPGRAPGEVLFELGAQGDGVLELQTALAAFGYCLPLSGRYDEITSQVVTAFQRHFRQERVDGCIDDGTIDILKRLNAACEYIK